mmetsp:Transcript_3715/g.7991  ORF Transcript_3715/g.7991 Transcript_3715/m.7991 type:complete len:320 (-) Transcript_3715:1139-2098(-)|eukprot:CAMPEP_0202892232 /NCGR_PEP_ID=MMETSP1392-20130828/1998_1 /ASSEMBLY_ACC=CAM_ASM_000868 /TAXON_ID=225041 /ORGANISM="Chlamydomonas chlamydogama, Strain SAG 11-48b" /LENGTH=319 /DNA_ID=CAMNT_0049576123 /DNA_START=267 /DNA_END=1226 /DNA_ORIENTATION=+
MQWKNAAPSVEGRPKLCRRASASAGCVPYCQPFNQRPARGRSLRHVPLAVLQRDSSPARSASVGNGFNEAKPAPPQLIDTVTAMKLNKLLLGVTEMDTAAAMESERIVQEYSNRSSQVPPETPGPDIDADSCWYFAYGANLHYDTLTRREVRVLSRDPAIVCDTNVRMLFKHRGGYATLQALPPNQQQLYPSLSEHVHGVLYRLRKEEMRKLQRREGGYKLGQMQVETYDGTRVKAWVFVSSPWALLPHEVSPTESYMRKLREGAADQFLDPMHQAWLSSVETVPSAGLPNDYFNTPSKYIAYGFLAMVMAVTAGCFLH